MAIFNYKEFKNNDNVFVIAELSANHNNNFDLAISTIDAIVDAGADAIKVQTFTPDSLTLDVDNEFFGPRKEGLWKGQRPYDLYKIGMLPFDWHKKLKDYAESKGLIFFSSPFDTKCVDFLEELDVPLYKIASAEITDIKLIEAVAKKGKPIIFSTGMAGLEDIDLAISTCIKFGNDQIILLKCTSEYPATIQDANLASLNLLKERYNVIVGISDHTMGSLVPIVSVALGAKVIEKHIILSRELGGIDSQFSMEPQEFKEMVEGVRNATKSIGIKSIELTEKNALRRRSIFISEDIKAGELITPENIKIVRPGNGLHPKFYDEIIGKSLNQDVKRGTPFKLDFIK